MLPEIRTLKSNIDGPTTLIMAGVHGNEMSGVVALEKLQALKPLCGEILLINANPSAQKQNKRYIERDLNRCFGQKKLGTLECKIAAYLEPYIQSCDYLLDIHNTTGQDSQAFLISEHTKLNSFFDVEIVLSGLDELHPGGTDGYTNSLGRKGLCLEVGSTFDDLIQTSAFAFDMCTNFLVGLGQTSGKASTFYGQQNIACTDMYITQTDSFRLEKDFADFEVLEQGQCIARDGDVSVLAEEIGVIVFPYNIPQAGREGFVLGKKLD